MDRPCTAPVPVFTKISRHCGVSYHVYKHAWRTSGFCPAHARTVFSSFSLTSLTSHQQELEKNQRPNSATRQPWCHQEMVLCHGQPLHPHFSSTRIICGSDCSQRNLLRIRRESEFLQTKLSALQHPKSQGAHTSHAASTYHVPATTAPYSPQSVRLICSSVNNPVSIACLNVRFPCSARQRTALTNEPYVHTTCKKRKHGSCSTLALIPTNVMRFTGQGSLSLLAFQQSLLFISTSIQASHQKPRRSASVHVVVPLLLTGSPRLLLLPRA